jgi:hypothetical protein
MPTLPAALCWFGECNNFVLPAQIVSQEFGRQCIGLGSAFGIQPYFCIAKKGFGGQ